MSAIARQLKEHRARTVVVIATVLLAGGFAAYWFSPQIALFGRRVDETLPSAAGPTPTPSHGSPATQATSTILATGAFTGIEHDTSGTAQLVELADGRVFLRLEAVEPLNGPDLRVYVSEAAPGGDPSAFGASFAGAAAARAAAASAARQVATRVSRSGRPPPDLGSERAWSRRCARASRPRRSA